MKCWSSGAPWLLMEDATGEKVKALQTVRVNSICTCKTPSRITTSNS